jgi:hypothetical protein
MPENPAEQNSKRSLEAIERIAAVRFQLIGLRFGCGLVGITLTFRG